MLSDRDEIVYLNTLDGFNFEDLCARIVEKLGWGKVTKTPKVKDGGKDLIIEENNSGIVLVECKHQPSTPIGRPVIQKLHSTVISSGASKGVVITTGKFTKDAVEHAKTLNPEITLVDLLKLTEMAENAGIKLVSYGPIIQNYFKRYASDSELERIQYSLINTLETHPRTVEELISFHTVDKGFLSVYSITYSIHESFSTTVGLIHSIDKDNQRLYLKGSTGYDAELSMLQFIKPADTSKLSPVSELQESISSIQSIGNKIDLVSLGNLAKRNITDKYTTRISYTGKNNVKYMKICMPSHSNIVLGNITNILLRHRTIRMDQKSYTKEFISLDSEDTILLDHPILFCDYCGDRKNLMICDSCSLIFDYGFGKHGKRCSICKKTICVNCLYKHKWPSFIRGYICEACAVNLYGKEYSKKRKLKRVHRADYWEKIRKEPTFKIS